MEYNLAADCLNKYSQLTPWVQAWLGLGIFAVMLGTVYFAKETVVAIMKPWHRKQSEPTPKEEKREWRDKYYRDENAH